MPQLAATWPLVGREQELKLISLARADAVCCGVVLEATAGIGKSRLAREAHGQAERDGAAVSWVQATRSAGVVPLGAFAEVVPDDVRSDNLLLLLRRSADALRERARGRPIVLVVDDAHLLDQVSAALVQHLATTAGVFVIATVRSGEPCPDAIVSLWKDCGARRLGLRRLEDTAVTDLVVTALGGPVTQRVQQWAAERSGGNALYLRELVTGAVDAGMLAEHHGLWGLSGAAPVSRSLVELVSQRMAGLTAEQRSVLEVLALAEPLRYPELTEIVGEDAVLAVETAGLIGVSGAGELRLAHPLYGDVVRAELSLLLARRLRPRIAAVLARREPMSGDTALRVATLLDAAGEPIPGGLLVQAGWAAILAGDSTLGARLGELAVADGGGVPATMLLARALAMTDRQDAAEAALAGIEDQMPGHELATEYLELRVRVLTWGLARLDEARALLDRAPRWSADPAWHQRVVALRHPILVEDDLAGALQASEALVADPALDAATRNLAEPRHAILLMYAGRWQEAEAVTRPVRPTPPVRGQTALMALPIHGQVGIESGVDWDDLEAYFARTLRQGVRCNDREAAAHAAIGLGQLAMLRGRLLDAARWLTEAELHFEHEDAFGTITAVYALQTGVAALTGDHDEVRAALANVEASLGDGRPRPRWVTAYRLRAQGWEACTQSPAQGVAKLLADAASISGSLPGYAVLLRYDALLAGAPASRVAPLLAEAAPAMRTRLVDLYAAHATALARRDAEALRETAEQFALAGASRYAMTAATDAANLFIAAGRQDSARRAWTRARELHVPDQGLPLPAVEGLDGAPADLTPRETQLVELAGLGLSNAEIADRLVLSVRTVESHIYRAMQKLGVSDRRDLPTMR